MGVKAGYSLKHAVAEPVNHLMEWPEPAPSSPAWRMDGGWMVSGQETVLCLVLVLYVTMVVSLVAAFTTYL